MRFIFEGGFRGQRNIVIAEGTRSAAQAEEDHGYLRSTYSFMLLSLRPGMEPGREALVEGFGAVAAIHNPGRSREKLDAVAQLC